MSEQIYKSIWDEALNQIHEEYKANGQENEFILWFKMDYVEDTMSDITVSVPSQFMWKMMVTKGNVKTMENKIEELCGQKINLKYVVGDSKQANSSESNQTEQVQTSVPNFSREFTSSVPHNEPQFTQQVKEPKTEPVPQKDAQPKVNRIHPDLKEEYTFDRFVCGDNSDFAYSASLAAAKEPGRRYSPLLIYGGVGLGKTHLMQAIGNYIYNNPPEGRENVTICYLSLENFTNEFTKSIREGTTEKFKNKYRSLDVLLLDDIQFLKEKEATQEELFHTFEALSQRKAQMVFTCDRPLSELNGIEDRLKSRFALGTPIDLKTPSYETRKAILQKKLELQGKTISDDVVDFIAKSVQSNVRELEACLNKLVNYAELLNKPLSIEIARKQLSDNITNTAGGIVTIDTIQKVVSNHYNISLSDIKGKKKSATIAFARQIAVYLSRQLTEYSFPQIASEFGGRDHTTIMHSCNKIESALKTDSNLNSTIDLLTREIKEYKKL